MNIIKKITVKFPHIVDCRDNHESLSGMLSVTYNTYKIFIVIKFHIVRTRTKSRTQTRDVAER